MKSTLGEENFCFQALRRNTVRRILATPEVEKEDQDLRKWFSEIRSTDPKILKALFQREWSRFEACIDNDKDKQKLKKMFDIK